MQIPCLDVLEFLEVTRRPCKQKHTEWMRTGIQLYRGDTVLHAVVHEQVQSYVAASGLIQTHTSHYRSHVKCGFGSTSRQMFGACNARMKQRDQGVNLTSNISMKCPSTHPSRPNQYDAKRLANSVIKPHCTKCSLGRMWQNTEFADLWMVLWYLYTKIR